MKKRVKKDFQNLYEKCGLSEAACARKIGVNQTTIHRWKKAGVPFLIWNTVKNILENYAKSLDI